jgi:hypothetical protein
MVTNCMFLKHGSSIKTNILWYHVLSNACKNEMNEQEPPKLVISFQSWVFQLVIKKHSSSIRVFGKFGMSMILKHPSKLKW